MSTGQQASRLAGQRLRLKIAASSLHNKAVPFGNNLLSQPCVALLLISCFAGSDLFANRRQAPQPCTSSNSKAIATLHNFVVRGVAICCAGGCDQRSQPRTSRNSKAIATLHNEVGRGVAVRCARLQQLCYCYPAQQSYLLRRGCDQRSLPKGKNWLCRAVIFDYSLQPAQHYFVVLGRRSKN